MNAEDAGQEGGREMDARVAEKLMGWLDVRVHGAVAESGDVPAVGLNPASGAWEPLPRYSTEIADAWRAVERLAGLGGRDLNVEVGWSIDGAYCELSDMSPMGYQTRDGTQLPPFAYLCAQAPTVPLAICRAALAALSPTLEDR